MKQGAITAKTKKRRRSATPQADLFDGGSAPHREVHARRTEPMRVACESTEHESATPAALPFHPSDDPYAGCEHGCVYCFARPAHRSRGHRLGLDFETVLYSKRNAAHVLAKQFDTPGYRPETLVLGANTDPYQPQERRQDITRDLLSLLWERKHPVSITTASTSVLRDLDLLQKLASERLVHVFMSISTLDQRLAATLEPRVASPRRRLDVMEVLREAGVSIGLVYSPVVPGLNDFDLERVVKKGHQAGASVVGYSLLRLQHEMKQVFESWLREHYPDRADKVLNLIRETRQGSPPDADPGIRRTGAGVYEAMVQQRFDRIVGSLALNRAPIRLRKDLFVGMKPRVRRRGQIPLF